MVQDKSSGSAAGSKTKRKKGGKAAAQQAVKASKSRKAPAYTSHS